MNQKGDRRVSRCSILPLLISPLTRIIAWIVCLNIYVSVCGPRRGYIAKTNAVEARDGNHLGRSGCKRNGRLLLPRYLEPDVAVPVGAGVAELIAVHPRYLSPEANGHQGGEEVVVAVAAYPASLVGVHLELVADLVPGTAAPRD